MKYVGSQTDYLVNRIVAAVQLSTEDPFWIATNLLVERMKEKQEEGSWNP